MNIFNLVLVRTSIITCSAETGKIESNYFYNAADVEDYLGKNENISIKRIMTYKQEQ